MDLPAVEIELQGFLIAHPVLEQTRWIPNAPAGSGTIRVPV